MVVVSWIGALSMLLLCNNFFFLLKMHWLNWSCGYTYIYIHNHESKFFLSPFLTFARTEILEEVGEQFELHALLKKVDSRKYRKGFILSTVRRSESLRQNTKEATQYKKESLRPKYVLLFYYVFLNILGILFQPFFLYHIFLWTLFLCD